MKHAAMWLVLVLLVACGRSGFLSTSVFASYVETFQRESVIYEHPTVVQDLVIQFSSDLDDKIAGQCRRYADASPLILINVRWWESFTADQKEILLLHEIGHCILGYTHDDTQPAIMNSLLLIGYEGRRKEMLAKYFRKTLDSVAALRYSFNRRPDTNGQEGSTRSDDTCFSR